MVSLGARAVLPETVVAEAEGVVSCWHMRRPLVGEAELESATMETQHVARATRHETLEIQREMLEIQREVLESVVLERVVQGIGSAAAETQCQSTRASGVTFWLAGDAAVVPCVMWSNCP